MAALSASLSSMSLTYTSRIHQLGTPYRSLGACIYSDDKVIIQKRSTIRTNGFMGSPLAISFNCTQGSITCDAPGCLAAPIINMVAQQSICLGTHELSEYQPSMRPLGLYAPDILTIQTYHLFIGNIQVLEPFPLTAQLSCTRLSVINFSAERTTSLLTMIQKWLIHPAAIDIAEPAPILHHP